MSFAEEVRELLRRRDVWKGESMRMKVANKVVINLNMLGQLVEDWLNNLYGTLIITVE